MEIVSSTHGMQINFARNERWLQRAVVHYTRGTPTYMASASVPTVCGGGASLWASEGGELICEWNLIHGVKKVNPQNDRRSTEFDINRSFRWHLW